ncbi:MAG: protoporphyrinogen oxidase, partial [Firmicutes bacterium]|nr:protoporphyrinogen oxidase [Bacillota bacterium]
MADTDVIVIGAGISGLSTSWFLHAGGADIRLIEASDRIGGVITTVRKDGFLLEQGPNTTLQKPGREEDAIGRLMEGAGLSMIAREASPLGKHRFILRDGVVRALPTSPPAFLGTRAFSWRAKARLMAEPFIGRAGSEETIAQFVKRRLGREFLDYAIDPFVSGVYAGDTKRLSVRAAVPRIHDLEAKYGSLIRGAIALGKAAKNAGMPAGRQVSFSDGMEAFPKGIADRLPANAILRSTRVVSLEPTKKGWRVETQSPNGPTTLTAKNVVLALPADSTAELIRPLAPEAARSIESIPYVSIVSAGLGYESDQIYHDLDGFGFLVPRAEGVRTLGALFSSSLFNGRAPDGHVLLTAFIGGAHDPEAIELTDDELTDRLNDDLAKTLGISGFPCFRCLSRWKKAIPQYEIGHLHRVAEIDRDLSGHAGLYLRGNW